MCRECEPGRRCVDEPTEAEPQIFACLTCGSERCTEHEGSIVLTQCPLKTIDGRTNEVLRFAAYARDSGMWPVAGGALDQSPAFLAAEHLIRTDRAAWRRHLGLE